MRSLSFVMLHLLFSQGAATSSSLVSAVEGLLRLFAAKMSPPPSLPLLAIRIFEMLLAQLHTHIIAMKTKMEKPSSQSGQLKRIIHFYSWMVYSDTEFNHLPSQYQ